MYEPVVIGISGGSGSGKTTIASAIRREFNDDVCIIPQDAYYKTFNLPFEEREKINFDHPDSFDTPLLIKHVKSLKKKVPVDMPEYDFKTHQRTKNTTLLQPKKIIILEGILIFANHDLRNEMDIKIYVDTDSDLRILRRIERDINERGRSLNSVIEQYRETVRPMHIQFIETTKRYADVIIPEGGHNIIGIDMILAKIKDIIR